MCVAKVHKKSKLQWGGSHAAEQRGVRIPVEKRSRPSECSLLILYLIASTFYGTLSVYAWRPFLIKQNEHCTNVHGVLFDKTNLCLPNLSTQSLHHVVFLRKSRVMSETLAQLWVWWWEPVLHGSLKVFVRPVSYVALSLSSSRWPSVSLLSACNCRRGARARVTCS